MANTSLLPLLANGDIVSGQALADALGVSRTAVWKQLKNLDELGLQIESVKGQGYRIPGGVELLAADRVLPGLSPLSRQLLSALDLRDIVGSTNAEAMAQIAAGSGSGYVCSAEQQSAGRGRRGRTWVSPYGRNLYLSAVWEYEQGAAVLEGMSLAVGVVVARALASCGVPPVQLKWPNDLLYRGAKFGGILLEMTGDPAGACQVVVGIGLNVDMPGATATGIDQAWTDVARICGGQAPPRNALLAALLDELLPMLASFEKTGFVAWRDEWQGLDAFAGVDVVLHSGSHKMAGKACGVDERGALQLQTTTGFQSIFGGEISLRPAP
ncbi:bifunctional biotin--[acetyl-CoA-carboxylase] ligase/biotin operon repressor BirA [Seongchinamella sediminis]|uniref:Bifunctional ligase/repressor BirA n=1 Tax=Seongchinamella sediminis TaxID=2283635 RepID=A0A3L7DZV2_9GAMM|nr:bifunctional biotin--[acetyl-CoA-carboxylase] ligase/biotin operon repressor BirA [Seongchinamella sediminis]RLQ22199.1 bifunctional biotin--[acetyl-CoA-carboxylase] ligase/biotin operon repressor BirA [Seongchinamella sediminis]